jgi:hypothetical protein
MTDTIGSTPQQPSRSQSGPEPTRSGRFRLPEPELESADAGAAQPTRSTRSAFRSASAQRAEAEAESQLKAAAALDERYGKKRGAASAVRKVGLVVIGLLILGGVVGYIGWQQANPTIQGTVTKFVPASDNSVVVTFEVDKPANRNATCTLAAEDVHGTVIGTAAVPIMAGREKNVQDYTLKTTTAVNTVIVQSCSLTS